MAFLNKSQKEYLKDFSNSYNKKTPLSKMQAAKSREFMSDPRGAAGFNLVTKELLYPIVAKEGRASRFIDIDDNEYVDISMGFGSLLFGHMPNFLSSTILKHLDTAIQLGPQTALAFEVAKMICELTCSERIAFCNTGTEAIMYAIRLARLRSGKQKIVIFTDSYHGSYDPTLGISLEKQYNNVKPFVEGLPHNIFENVLILEYGDEKCLEKIYNDKFEIAAILVEPVRGRFPDKHSKSFLESLRFFSSENNIYLIFDEVVTGFRCHMGGAQAYFNIKADLVIYGKALACGLPIGVLAGNADILSGIDGGYWEYGDTSFPKENTTFFAGTFNKNPLTIIAAKAFLDEIKRHGNSLQVDLENKTKNMENILNKYFLEENIDLKVVSFSSLFRFKINYNAEIFFYHLLYNNLYVWEGKSLYMCAAHTEEDIQFIIDTIKNVSKDLTEKGFISAI